jgi:ubiquinone/menaquinone biosynthesis C-methylase UbiE
MSGQIDPQQLTKAWNSSYDRRENFVFWPCDEIVRFVSRHLRRRIGLDEVIDVLPGAKGSRMVDIGCGIGRNLMFGTEMGFEMHGIDLSAAAAAQARTWLSTKIGPAAESRVLAGSVTSLPWEDGYFAHGVSDSVLDSMPFETAQLGIAEIVRVIRPGGYFYCNLISGDETGRDPEFCSEVIVTTVHESDTVQSYFNQSKVFLFLQKYFEIVSCELHKISDPIQQTHSGRWHIISRRR